MHIENHLDHSFCASLISNAQTILDCGANHGEFSTWLSQHSTAQVYAFEPDPGLFAALPKTDRVEWVPKAVDGESGYVTLAIGNDKCSSMVYRESDAQETVEVETVSLDDFCQQKNIQKIDLLKMDIEGAELRTLEMASAKLLSSITQITVEFHDFLNQDDVPRIQAIFKRLESLGFMGIRYSWHTWGDCLFVNTNHVEMSFLDRMRIGFIKKYSAGVSRMLGNLIKSDRRG